MVRMPDDMVDRTPYQNILYEKDPEDNRLLRITLNQPERMNALSNQLTSEMKKALDEIENDEGLRVLIVTGAGDKASQKKRGEVGAENH